MGGPRAGQGKYAVNDPAESSMAGMTREIECFGRIAIPSAAGVGQARFNGDLWREIIDKKSMKAVKKKSSRDGIFHSLSKEMSDSLLTMSLEDMKEVRKKDGEALAAQRKAKRRKEELAKAASMEKGQEAFIDALYYHEMYGSAACWKTAQAVDRELAKLKTKTAKLEALKENIKMRVVGLGFSDLATAWSKDGKEFTPHHLAAHLKTIITATRSRTIPAKPPIPLPERKALPSLGVQAHDAAALDLLQLSKGTDFEAEARRVRAEREAAGIGDPRAEKQQQSRPLVDKALLGKRLEICCDYDLDEGGSEPRWCAGEVVLVSDGSNIPIPGKPRAKYKAGAAVMIHWDEPQGESWKDSAVELLPSQWNPKGIQLAGGWRFDL